MMSSSARLQRFIRSAINENRCFFEADLPLVSMRRS